jgi:(S)-ureidoglycine-glyoxylate aminotransferase
MAEPFEELNPPARLLMGPGPVNADPRVLRAMSMPLLGQFDPDFTRYMNEVMALYRRVFQTANRWTFVVDGTARAGIEAALVSLIRPGDRVLVPVSGRFGQLLTEIAERCRADVRTISAEWGMVFEPDQIEDAIKQHRPKLVATVHGDTSTTMAQPLKEIGAICRAHDVLLYVDATATLGGMEVAADDWNVDAMSAGLQKCLSGPPGCAPLTFNDRIADLVNRRKHIERGIRPAGVSPGEDAPIQSNYFDLPMLMDYWGEARLNHHTEATSMLYAARECARIAVAEGVKARARRHELTSQALTAGLAAMGLELFGDQRHKMPNVTGVLIPNGTDGYAVIRGMLRDFAIEIGTSFGPLRGKIWRIGTMGYNSRKDTVTTCLAALEATLRQNGYSAPPGSGVDAALAVYRTAGQ